MNAAAYPRMSAERVVPLAEAVDINPRPERGLLADDSDVTFVPMAALEAMTGRIDTSVVRPFGAVNRGYTVFREGDVLFAKITPCMENGKMAVARGLRNGVGCGSTEFHVLRPKPGVEPQYVYYIVSSGRFRAEAAHHMAGAVGHKRVPAAFLETREILLPSLDDQRRIVAEVEKQFSRLDDAMARFKRVKANAQRFERATIQALTAPESFSTAIAGTIADVAFSLDNMRVPVNKTERARRAGTIPYLGANGQAGWIDEARFDEELVLVVEDETFVGRSLPFSYYFSGKCWVNNHTHVLRARRDVVLPKYLNLALSYYPFVPLTTGSTGRRKLTKSALMSAPIVVPDLLTQHRIVTEVDRRLSIVRKVEVEVDATLRRVGALRHSILDKWLGRNARGS